MQVHPVTFHRVLDLLDAAGWQVRQETKGLRVLVAAPRVDVDTDAIRRAIEAALDRAGASSAGVVVSFVDTSPSGAAGKRPT